MDAAKTDEWAHPVCSCRITTGNYCSAQCEAMEKTRTSITGADITAAKAKLTSQSLHGPFRFHLTFIKGEL